MPTLNWIGKAAVVEHHKEVPFRLLKCRDDLSVGDPQAGNLLVQGDNLEALKALLPYYAEQVKCIYIDPPYNTGNEAWVYNDAMKSPEMRDWLGKVVGGDAEDLSRHDKWLCMMYPRLALLHQMLRGDGSLWMSIDDNEVHNARAIMDEIFGAQNFVTTIIWEKLYSPKSSARHFSANHDYIIVYAKNAVKWERNLLSRTEEQDKRYKNPDNDPRGLWKPGGLDARNFYSLGTYSITAPSGRVISGPPNGAFWRVSKEKLDEMDKDGRIWWGETGNNVPSIKRFLTEVRQGLVPETIWPYSEVGHTQEAKQEIVKILQDAFQVFTTPKPTRLIQRIIQLSTNDNDLVLDSFAGSGTTGHAVLKQNIENNGNRRFILVEMDTNIAPNITAERLKRVVQGYAYNDQKGNEKTEAGLGGGFRFCELGVTLFDPTGQIRPEVKYEDLAQHIHFIETGSPLPRVEKPQYPLLGVHNGLAIYLLYNGVLKDKSPNGGNVLTYELLETLPPYDGLKIIYANGCRIGEQRLRDLGIVFKQIPYEIRER
ncbi:MAG: site-specific DNA-methyltransferase [Chloroflexota bacterium]